MKLSQIASKPKLTKIVLDSQSILDQYEDKLEFWTWDRLPLDTFMKMASADSENIDEIFELVKPLIMDEDGKVIIDGEVTIPNSVLIEAMNKLMDVLGK